MAIVKSIYRGQSRIETIYEPTGESLLTDAPKQSGGLGQHPTPVALLAKALLACELTTVGMAVTRGGCSMQGAWGEVSDIKFSETRDAVDSFDVNLHLSSALDAKQRERVEAFAHKACTVGNTLNAQKHISFFYDV